MSDAAALLDRSLENDRLHSAYLVSGPGDASRDAALRFARGIVCRGTTGRPCEACDDCRRSQPGDEIALDGTGKKGPLYRHVGHMERAAEFLAAGAGEGGGRARQARRASAASTPATSSGRSGARRSSLSGSG